MDMLQGLKIQDKIAEILESAKLDIQSLNRVYNDNVYQSLIEKTKRLTEQVNALETLDPTHSGVKQVKDLNNLFIQKVQEMAKPVLLISTSSF